MGGADKKRKWIGRAMISSAPFGGGARGMMHRAQAMANALKRIGLISDTHGLLREEAVEALRGSD